LVIAVLALPARRSAGDDDADGDVDPDAGAGDVDADAGGVDAEDGAKEVVS
jgi:hypothetical protein